MNAHVERIEQPAAQATLITASITKESTIWVPLHFGVPEQLGSARIGLPYSI
ncbi:MAG: hypothetical protein QGD88_12725 [Anaerolineae bacterium]|nr:hypothetical protein [Anaerolineae bacterium]